MLEDPNAVDPGELGEFFESQADRANRAEPARPNNSTTRPKPPIVLAVMFASFAGYYDLEQADNRNSPLVRQTHNRVLGFILAWVFSEGER